jgi:hypothetical protein
MRKRCFFLLAALGLAFACTPAEQEPSQSAEADSQPTITGVPGSPAATTTIDGRQLPPPPDKHFGGKIERNVLQSTPYWPPRVVAPEDVPNILLIITDDAGYGVAGTFGGVIPTPAMDRIALPTTACGTRISIRRQCAHRLVQRSSPGVIITRLVRERYRSCQQASPVTTAS